MGKTGVYLLLSKLPSVLLGLIFFFSATQLGLHFWPLSTLVYGVRIDYLSPTLYFLDILIILYLAIKRSDLVGHPTRSDLIGVAFPILLTNLLFSQNHLATLSWSFHFMLYFVFLRSVLSPGSDLVGHPTRSDPTGMLKIILPLSLLFQLLLATTQVWLGHSVGGLMYYLGERTVAVGTPGTALGSFMYEVVLRGYGTFSHPNVLAGWSIIVFLIFLLLSPRSDLVGCKSLSKPTRSDLMGVPILLILTSLLVLLTQSRAGALTLFGLVIPLYLIKNLKLRLFYCFITLLLYYFVFPSILTPTRSDLSLTQRLDLQGVSSQVIRQYPIFGTGAQASTSTYPTVAPENRLFQPDHNSFTLFLSWFGIFGVLAILYSLHSFIIHYSLFIIPLVPLLALDHYFLTSPQGLFISLLYFYVALNYTHVKNYR